MILENTSTNTIHVNYTLKDKPMNVLEVANKLVSEDRQTTYGHPAIDFNRTAAVLNGLGFRMFNHKDGGIEDLTSAHIPIMMIAVKLSRIVNNEDLYHEDSYVDIAGYTKTAQMVNQVNNEVTKAKS